MENVIIFLIVAVVVIMSIIKNYNKEKEKNKGRKISKPLVVRSEKPTPTPAPFSKKTQSVSIPESVIAEIQQPVVEESVIQMQMNKYLQAEESATKKLLEDPFALSATKYNNFQKKEVVEDVESLDLELNTPQDYRRAFIHSLIFERKY